MMRRKYKINKKIFILAISSGCVCILGGLIAGLAVYGAGLTPKSVEDAFPSSKSSILSVNPREEIEGNTDTETTPPIITNDVTLTFVSTVNNRTTYNAIVRQNVVAQVETPSTLSVNTILSTLRWANVDSDGSFLKQLYSTTNSIALRNGLVDANYQVSNLAPVNSITNSNVFASFNRGININFTKNTAIESQLLLGKEIHIASIGNYSDVDLSFLSNAADNLVYTLAIFNSAAPLPSDARIISDLKFTSDAQELKFDVLVPIVSDSISENDPDTTKFAQNRIVISKANSQNNSAPRTFIVRMEEILPTEAFPQGREDQIALRNIPITLAGISIILKTDVNDFPEVYTSNAANVNGYTQLTFKDDDTVYYNESYFKASPNNRAIPMRRSPTSTAPAGTINTNGTNLSTSAFSNNYSQLEVTVGSNHNFFNFIIPLTDAEKGAFLAENTTGIVNDIYNRLNLDLTSSIGHTLGNVGLVLKYENYGLTTERLIIALDGMNLSNVRLLEVKFSM